MSLLFIQAMEEQFPHDEGYRITDYKSFKFKENNVRVIPTYECDKLIVTLNPISAEVTQCHALIEFVIMHSVFHDLDQSKRYKFLEERFGCHAVATREENVPS